MQLIQYFPSWPKGSLIMRFILVHALLVLLVCNVGAAMAQEPDSILDDVKKALDDRECQYQQTDVMIGYSGEVTMLLPDEVKMVRFSCGDIKRAKADYYIPEGWFTKEKYIVSKIYIYSSPPNADIKYIVWVKGEENIQRIIEKIPLHSIMKDPEKGSETLEDEWIYFDKNGLETKRVVTTMNVDHNRLTARFTETVLDKDGNQISTHSGGWDYDDLFCPPENRHCN